MVDLFNHYAPGGLRACAVYQDTELDMKAETVVIVAVPSILENCYMPSALRRIHTIVCDNAEMLFKNGNARLGPFLENIVKMKDTGHLIKIGSSSDSSNDGEKQPPQWLELEEYPQCTKEKSKTQRAKKTEGKSKVPNGNDTKSESEPSTIKRYAAPGPPTADRKQFVFVMSGVPSDYPSLALHLLRSLVPKKFIARIQTPPDINLSPSLSHQFIRVESEDEKVVELRRALAGLIRTSNVDLVLQPRDCPKVLVVCRKMKIKPTAAELNGCQTESTPDLTSVFAGTWWEGLSGTLSQTQQLHPDFQTFLAGSTRLLVCTSRVLTGLHLPQVDAVIFFDFPRLPRVYMQLAKFVKESTGKGVCSMRFFVQRFCKHT